MHVIIDQTPFDPSGQVGGMSRDFLYQGRPHPLGTSLFQESYSSSLIPLAEEYGLEEKIRFKERGIWRTNCANDTNSKLTGKEAIVAGLQQISGSPSTKANVFIFLQVSPQSGHPLVHRQLIDISGCTSRCLAQSTATSCSDQVTKCSTGPGALSKTSSTEKTSALLVPSSNKSLKCLGTVVWIRWAKF